MTFESFVIVLGVVKTDFTGKFTICGSETVSTDRGSTIACCTTGSLGQALCVDVRILFHT